MKEPTRLMQGSGPARELMTGSGLRVPSDARRRALQFTGVAAGLTASGTAAAAAGGTSLLKTLVLTLSLGAAGGGALSLAASKAYTHLENTQPAPTQLAPRTRSPRAPAVAAATTASGEQPPEAPAEREAPEARTEPSSTSSPTPGKSEARATPASKPNANVAPPATSVAQFHDAPARPSLFEEQRIIEQARSAVARGDVSGSLALLDGYERRPQRQFGPEALALRVQALAASGDRAAAGALAQEFARKYPHHPLLSRVQSSVARNVPVPDGP